MRSASSICVGVGARACAAGIAWMVTGRSPKVSSMVSTIGSVPHSSGEYPCGSCVSTRVWGTNAVAQGTMVAAIPAARRPICVEWE